MQYVKTNRDIIPWYSGYGANPVYTIPAGSIGIVTNNHLIPVTGAESGRKGNVLARFQSHCGSWQAELSPSDFETVAHSPYCLKTVCHISCPIGD